MTHHLTFENTSISVREKGAELSSWKVQNKELIWNADPTVWNRHAPILFPIVGALKNNSYLHNNQSYSLPRHGFARDLNLTLLCKDQNKLSFQLKSSPETKALYPFDFSLTINYELINQGLIQTVNVENIGENQMLFSLGFHPAFMFWEGGTVEDYFLKFQNEENFQRHLLDNNGLRNGQYTKIQDTGKELFLTDTYFEEDAIILENIQSNSAKLINKKTASAIKLTWQNLPHFGIWKKPGSNVPFLCLEPWSGLADKFNANGPLIEKEYITPLQPSTSQSFTLQFTFES